MRVGARISGTRTRGRPRKCRCHFHKRTEISLCPHAASWESKEEGSQLFLPTLKPSQLIEDWECDFFLCFLGTKFLHTLWQSKALGDGMYAARAIPDGFYWGENDKKVI